MASQPPSPIRPRLADIPEGLSSLHDREPITALLRELGLIGQSYLPPSSRIARALGGAADVAGELSTAPAKVNEVVGGLPRRALGAAASGIGSIAQYALADPNAPATLAPTGRIEMPDWTSPSPSSAQPSVAPSAATTSPRLGDGRTQFPLSPEAQARSAVDPSPLNINEGPEYEKRAAETTTTPRSPMRAIRLPNGRVLFTNREEYGGEELTTAQGGEVVRERQRREAPARAALTGMLRASMRATEREAAGGGGGAPGTSGPRPLPRGRMVPGTTPDMRPGVSVIEGTPEIQRGIALQDALGALALARAKQEIEAANLPVEKRAALEDPNIRAMEWVRTNIQPRIDAINQWAAEESARVTATIKDPREQARQLGEIAEEARQQIAALNTVASMGSRQRLPLE